MRYALRAVLFVLLPAGIALAAVRPPPAQLRTLLNEILASGYRLEPPATVRLGDYLNGLFDRLARCRVRSPRPAGRLPMWATWMPLASAGCSCYCWHMISACAPRCPARACRPHDGGDQWRGPAGRLAAASGALGGGSMSAIRLLITVLLRSTAWALATTLRTNWETWPPAPMTTIGGASLAELTQAVDAAVYAGLVTPEVAERCRHGCGRCARRWWVVKERGG